MSKKIFEEDVMCRECKAIVQACEPFKDGFGIVLDQTVFFPEGGGQLSDSGWLIVGDQRIPVGHVRIQDEVILHETAQAIPTGTEVEAVLDWPVRFDHMQQHCGEHLLSYAFWKLFQADNVGFHMNPELVTIDLNKEGDDKFFLTGAIHVIATNTDISEDELLALVEKTHTVCPYSKAVAGNVEMALSASVA